MKNIKNIALVDDDNIFVFLTTKVLKASKLVGQIEVYDNGLDALNFIKANLGNVDLLPEIILLDLSMPIMDGWQFLDEYVKLKGRIGKEITIFICSSSISPDDITKAKAISQVYDFIIKPVTTEKLVEMIRDL